MSVQVKHRCDTAANISVNTPAQGELWIDLTNTALVVGDGFTLGGWRNALESYTAISDATYAVSLTDRIVAFRSLTTPQTVLLPSSGTYPKGAQLTIVDLSGNASGSTSITAVAATGDQIKGSAPIISSAYGSMSLLYDATTSTWVVLGGGSTFIGWSALSSSQTIVAPGQYKVTSPGITLALPNGGVGGNILIKDGTGSSNPSISLSGSFDGQAGFSLSRPNAAITLSWDFRGSTYIVF